MVISAVLPENCDQAKPPQSVWDGMAYLSRWTTQCTGGLEGGKIRIDGLDQTSTDVLVRFDFTDGPAESRRLTTDLEEKNSLLDNAYRELEVLDGVKNELINRLSLDLRTPVTSLSTAAKILHREKDVRGDKTGRLVTIIHDEAEKLLEIIQSIFQASVLGSDTLDLKRSLVPAQDLFRKAIAPLRDLAEERQVKVHVLIPSGLESIRCEPDSSEAALRAVIKNGIEFNHPGGDVKLEVRRVVRGEEPWLHLRVADTGTGISDQDLPRVCEPFYQGDDSQAGKRHGIGLGLAIAKRVMENHGGSITITSNPTDGTAIVMAIPQTEG